MGGCNSTPDDEVGAEGSGGAPTELDDVTVDVPADEPPPSPRRVVTRLRLTTATGALRGSGTTAHLTATLTLASGENLAYAATGCHGDFIYYFWWGGSPGVKDQVFVAWRGTLACIGRTFLFDRKFCR